MDKYYDEIASGYDELHEQEQLKKLEIIKKELKISKKTKLLDVGCGTGISSNFDCDVTGIDPSEELLKIAGEKFTDKQFILASAENLLFKNKEFNVVVSLTAIQNFDDLEKGLKEIKRVGKEFALSYLKKSNKAKEIEEKINKIFSNYKIKKIEEEKDIILIIN
jgi:demethylmenaquinone methyltransferase/2-methoxy-6-polyprenyl-1,4-benzoquinol methylase